MSDVHDLIAEGLKANISMDDIVADLASSDNEEERAWAEKWKSTAAAPEYQAGAGMKEEKSQGTPSTGLLEKIDQMSPGELAAGAAATYGVLKAPGLYQDYQQNKQAERRLAIDERRNDLYAQQVNKQGMAPAAVDPNIAPELTGAPEAPKLSPLEEARINTERARAEAIQAKIALEERKIAVIEQKAKAAEEAKAAAASAQKTTASGAVNPEERQMLNSSEKAKMDKANTAMQKAEEVSSRAAQAAQALAVPPPAAPVAPDALVAVSSAQTPAPAPAPVANQPVVPPKGPEITLTPSAEVVSEMQVVPKEAVPQEAPRPAGSVPPKAKDKLTFKKIEELPKDSYFRAGLGGGDSWLNDTVGPDIRKFIIDEFNGGKPIGGGKEGMDKAYGMVGKYEQWLKENIPEQTLTRSERKFAGIPPAKQYGPLGKVVKVAGATGLLMTAAQSANASELARNVGEALLPIGATPSELAPGTLTEKQLNAFREAEKLGSPYRTVKKK